MSEHAQALTMEGATFDVFRKRARGGVLTAATLAYILIAIVFYGVFLFLTWAAMGDYMNWALSMQTQPPTELAAMAPPPSVLNLIAAALAFTVVYYILFAAYEAACLRWLVRGEAGGGLFGLTLGADTWRVYFGYWIWFFLILGIYLAMIVVGVVLGMAVGGAMGEAQGGAAALFAFGYILLCIAVLAWIGVRLAPAAACSVARGKFAFFKAWSVTRGRFWSLFGAFAFLFVIFFVTVLLIYGIGIFTVLGSVFTAAMSGAGDPTAIAAAMAVPGTLIGILVIYGLILAASIVFLLAMFGVNARAAAVSLAEGRI